MKLSEAMRLGAMATKQAFGAYEHHQGGSLVATCALGAAFHAVGVALDNSPMDSEVSHEWGFWTAALTNCPACWANTAYLASQIEHLNDTHHWSRERIADWIEREVEAKQEQPQSAEAVTV